MYLGSWKIDDYLTFPANTHDPSDGAASDADSAPSYRIYEDETATPILTGSLALLDSANTTGFYTERIQLTAANGFEKGKTYTIYIQAAVSSITGTLSHTFQIEAEVDANTVSDKTGYALSTTPPTAAAIADAILDETLGDHLGANSFGLSVSSTGGTVTEIASDMATDHAGISGQIATVDNIIDAIKAYLDELIEDDGSGNNRYTAKALEEAPTSGSQSGSTEVADILIDDGTNPIEGAAVWITTDTTGTNVIWAGNTNTNGYPKDNAGNNPFLDPGTYYVWVQKGGYTFSNPTSKTVS